MELSTLLDHTRYCIGSAPRGVGSWTYVNLLGHQIKEHWNTDEFRSNVMVSAAFSIPIDSKWREVKLPDGQAIVVREHLGAAVPDLPPVNWETMPSTSSLRKPARKPMKVNSLVTLPAAVSETVEDEAEVSALFPLREVIEAAAIEFAAYYSQQPRTARSTNGRS